MGRLDEYGIGFDDVKWSRRTAVDRDFTSSSTTRRVMNKENGKIVGASCPSRRRLRCECGFNTPPNSKWRTSTRTSRR